MRTLKRKKKTMEMAPVSESLLSAFTTKTKSQRWNYFDWGTITASKWQQWLSLSSNKTRTAEVVKPKGKQPFQSAVEESTKKMWRILAMELPSVVTTVLDYTLLRYLSSYFKARVVTKCVKRLTIEHSNVNVKNCVTECNETERSLTKPMWYISLFKGQWYDNKVLILRKQEVEDLRFLQLRKLDLNSVLGADK